MLYTTLRVFVSLQTIMTTVFQKQIRMTIRLELSQVSSTIRRITNNDIPQIPEYDLSRAGCRERGSRLRDITWKQQGNGGVGRNFTARSQTDEVVSTRTFGSRGDARQRSLRRASTTERRAVCHDDGRPERLAARQARIPARKDAQYVAERAARYRPNIARSWTRHSGGGGEPLSDRTRTWITATHKDGGN